MAAKATERNSRLGVALKRARRQAGYNQTEAAALFGCSQSMICRIEAGTRALMSGELGTYLRLLGASRNELDEVAGLMALPDEPVPAGLSPNPRFLTMLRAIGKATEVLTFHSEGLPAHLQSDPYILRQHQLFDTQLTETEILRGRQDRLRLFTEENPPACRALVAESSLTRMPGGGSTIICEQARHLLDLLENVPRLSLRVVRTNAPITHVTASFTIVRMPGRAADMVYMPALHDGFLIKDGQQVDEHVAYWGEAWQAALTEDESKKFIHELAQHGAPLG